LMSSRDIYHHYNYPESVNLRFGVQDASVNHATEGFPEYVPVRLKASLVGGC
jgi:hypothetical protein